MNIEELKKYKYVSFDIFKTLVFRNVSNDVDIFKIVEIEYNKNYDDKILDFKNLRINAEINAREKSKDEEITLDEIYDNLNIKNKEKIKELEINIEKSFIVRNKEMFDIYQNCLKNNIKIIITSDMYLDRKTIEYILLQNGYDNYEKFLIGD